MPTLNLTIESPGVEIREIDNSQNPVVSTGTNIYVVGFAAQGPTDEPTYISSLAEYEEIFGLPETAAERYAHNTVKQILTTSTGSVLFTRLPYGSGCGFGYSNSYSALVFPIVGLSASEIDICDYYSTLSEEELSEKYPWLYNGYYIKPTLTIGSNKFTCPQSMEDSPANATVIHDYKFQYDGELKQVKWIADDDTSAESITFYVLRPVVDSQDCEFEVVDSFVVASDETPAPSDGIYTHTLSSAIEVKAGDLIASYSSGSVLKYYNAVNGKSTIIETSGDSISGESVIELTGEDGEPCLGGSLDYLVQFVYSPAASGLNCETLLELGVTVPEEDRYEFNPIPGDAKLEDANFYVIGEPIHVNLNDEEYERLKNQQFNWQCGALSNVDPLLDLDGNDVRAGFIVINEIKSAQLEDYSGYYVAINDNLTINPTTDYDDVTDVYARFDSQCLDISGAWEPLPEDRRNFQVSAPFDGEGGSISEIIEQNAGFALGDPEYNDCLIVSLFKLRPTRFTEDIIKLDQILVEKYVGSVDSNRMIQDSFGGPPRTMYIEDVVNRNSRNISLLVNPFLSENNCWTSPNGLPQKTVRIYRQKTGGVFDNFDYQKSLKDYGDKLFGIGQYNSNCRLDLLTRCEKKNIGNLPCKLTKAINAVSNHLEYDIDITVDSGLSTIWATKAGIVPGGCLEISEDCYNFDDTVYINTDSLSPNDGTKLNSEIADAWTAIYNIFSTFASGADDAGYPGHLHIQDPLRQIFVNGKDFKVIKRQSQTLLDPVTGAESKRYSTFSRNIYSYLKNLYRNANSSYVASYPNWIKGYDVSKDKYVWYPASSYVAPAMARTDANYYPWFATMGTTRGALFNVLDLAINPNQKERDLLYRINLNPIINLPNEGNLIWGQKTLLRTNSALDRINVRRGLLSWEKATQVTLWQFIGEPNSIVTRTRLVNALTPIFETAKLNQGVYNYQIICDNRNNTPSSVDQNVINVDIYIQPTKTGEMIKANFIITRTGIDFGELM